MNAGRMLAVVVAAALVAGCGTDGKKTAGFEERSTVERVDLRDVMSQTGEIAPIVKVEVKSEASGRIERILVKEGARVDKGDTLLVIDPVKLLNRKKRLDLALRRNRLEAERARRELEHGQALSATGTVSAKQLQDLQEAFDLADIATKQQLLELNDVTDELGKTVVVAPMNGVVTALDVEEGEIAVSATTGFQGGTSIGTIADISRLEVVSEIGEVDYVKLKLGQSVVVRPQAFDDVHTRGTVTFIALSAKKKTGEDLGKFEVRVSIDSIVPGIAPGINVYVDYVLMEKNGVLGVPYQYVEKKGKDHFVEVAGSGRGKKERGKRVAIQVGATDYRYYEVLSGLEEGQTVVFREKAAGAGAGGPPGGGGRH